MHLTTTRLRTLPILLGGLAGCGSLPCGEGTQEKDGLCVAMAQQSPAQTTAIKLTYLKLDHTSAQPIYVHNPLHVTVGLTSSGAPRVVNLSMGLIKRLADGQEVAPKDFPNHPGCFLGGDNAVLNGGGAEQRFDYTFTIPQECLRSDQPATVNPAVFFDADGQSGEKDNVILLTAANRTRPENQSCSTLGPDGATLKDCSVDLTLKPSPGVDVALTAITPQSSIAILYPQTPPKDLGPGKREDLVPLLTVEHHSTVFGRDVDDTDSDLLPDVFWIVYDIQAPGSSDLRWMPLYFTAGEQYLERPRLKPNTDNREQIDLYAQQEIYDLVTTGAWANQEDFLLRGCLQPYFTERGDELMAGMDGTANNCQVLRIKLVKAQPRGQSASAYSLDTDWNRFTGSSGSIGLYSSFYSHNRLDLSGATTDTDAYSGINTDSFIGQIDLIHLWGRGAVPVSIVDSYVDVGVQVIGENLFTYYRSVPEVDYSKDDLSFSKQLCKSFTYYALPLIDPTIQICAIGTVSMPVHLTINGMDQPGMVPPKLGVVEAMVTPTANFTASATATVSLLVVRGGVEGFLTLFQASLPVAGGVNWGLTNLAPLTLQVGGHVDCDLRLSTLDGLVNAFIDTWSFWSGWGRKGTYNICQWSGLSTTYSLLHRNATTNLGQ